MSGLLTPSLFELRRTRRRHASRNDGDTQLRIPAARSARVLHRHWPSKTRGRREHRVPLHPRVSCARHAQKTHTSHSQVQPNTLRHSLRDGLRLIRALLGVPCSLAAVVPRYVSQDLIPASEDRDHTISLVREECFRRRGPSRAEHPHVHRSPCPTSVTTAIRPSQWTRDGERQSYFSGKRKRNIFRGGA
jgi:hypothetical protein